MNIEPILNGFTIIGIVLEIWGFIWLLKYGRTPTEKEYDNWLKKKKFDESWKSDYTQISDMGLDSPVNKIKDRLSSVHVKFPDFWNGRRSWSITLVIIGLFLQIIQVTLPYFCDITNCIF